MARKQTPTAPPADTRKHPENHHVRRNRLRQHLSPAKRRASRMANKEGQALATLALAPLRLLLPGPPISVPLEVHNTLHSPFPSRRALPDLLLPTPWTSLSQARRAVLQHCGDEASLRKSEEMPLRDSLAATYVHVHEGAVRACSIAFACGGWCGAAEDVVGREAVDGRLWVALTERSVLTILHELAQGRGKLVVRTFWYWGERGRHPREVRAAMLRAEERRGCEVATAAGSPVQGPGSPWTVPGSPGSGASSGGSVGVRRESVWLGEPAVCESCV